MEIQFPSSFLWGAALSSYQCEGNIFFSDWSDWGKERDLEQAKKACDHYNLFKQDFQFAKQLHLNSLRFSIEWSRICPEPSVFSRKELEHYDQVLISLKENHLKPLVTLHHFTNPLWFAQNDGWANSRNIDLFLDFVKKIVTYFQDKVDIWLILNEPLVYIYQGYISGAWPPGSKSLLKARKVYCNMLSAYRLAYQEIKNIYKEEGQSVSVSLAKHLRIFSPCSEGNRALNAFSAFTREKIFNRKIIDYLKKKRCLDFLGVNYYCREYVQFKGVMGQECPHAFHEGKRNRLGWYLHPEGLYTILKQLKKYNLPIIITENGTAEDSNSSYQQYLFSHLNSVGRALADGVDIQGYLWWSLLDNFEWDKGFSYRFGLLEVDYNTQQRKIRPFAAEYGKICKNNCL